MKLRRRLNEQRRQICDCCLVFASFGVTLSIAEAELAAATVPGFRKGETWSQILRLLILVSTIVLMVLIVLYHSREIKITVLESGANSWRVAVSRKVVLQISMELLICAICPFPGTGYIFWPCVQEDRHSMIMKEVPLDVILSVGMFLRSYLLARFMVVRSKQFHDAATRVIAGLNRVTLNFSFVLKTMMKENPVTIIIMFTLCFWICAAWMLALCDRYAIPQLENVWELHLNSLWVIVVTFLSIGYGNLVPHTYCGRAVAIVAGITGAGVSAAFIAVMGQKLKLSRAEKCVTNVVSDCELTRHKKNAAAAVLQHTWLMHKYRSMERGRNAQVHHRKFLRAMNKFRQIKWEQRMLAEEDRSLVHIGKCHVELHESVQEVRRRQNQMLLQTALLAKEVSYMEQCQRNRTKEILDIQEELLDIWCDSLLS